jgi:hypothetical protein
MSAARERKELGLEISEPRGALREKDEARLEFGRGDGHSGGHVAFGFHRDNPVDLAAQLLREESSGAGVLDQDACCAVGGGKVSHGGFQLGVIDALPPHVEQIAACIWSGFGGGQFPRQSMTTGLMAAI